MIDAIKGVIAPNLTPFNADLSVDTGLFVAHAKDLLEQGCSGLAPFGTTGEALSLGMAERLNGLEALVRGGADPARLIPGTGLTAVADTVTLTRHALSLGCAGAMILPPFYYKGVSDEGLFRAFAAIVEGVADARLKIYLYHIPPVAQVGLSLDLVTRLREAFPGTVVGIKDSGGDWENTQSLIDRNPGFTVYPGSELQFLRSLKAGAPGCITATANINAAAIRALYDARDTPAATAMEAKVDAFRKAVQPFGLIAALKGLLAKASGHPSWARVRPPLVELPRADVDRLAALLT